MKFDEVLSALKAGKKVRRKSRKDCGYIRNRHIFAVGEIINQDDVRYALTIMDLEATDWEIIREPKKVKLRDLTKKQYKYFCRRFNDPNDLYGNNGDYFDGTACNTCPCKDVICELQFDNCRFYHKDLYSNKFLDQKVETYDEDDLPREIEDYH